MDRLFLQRGTSFSFERTVADDADVRWSVYHDGEAQIGFAAASDAYAWLKKRLSRKGAGAG
jgi:hypothetical protein